MALDTNLVSYWKMDETSTGVADVTRADSKGSNTLDDASHIPSGTGIINNGADLERGSAQYFSITDAAQTGLDITGDCSFSFWMKLESIPSSGDTFAIITKRNTGAATGGYQISYVHNPLNTDLFEVMFYDDSSNATRLQTGDLNLSTGTWYHIAVTIDVSVPTIVLYINGTPNAATVNLSNATSIGDNAIAFQIGKNSVTDYFDGILDEVGVWTKVLSAAEVIQLYNGGVGLGYPFGPRYWVGGTGTWDNSTTTHWSGASGGSGGESVPDAYHGAVFDGSSGSDTVTTGANIATTDVDFTGYAGTFAGTNTLNLSGSLTLGTGMTNSFTGAITFSATTTGKTLTTGGKTIGSTLTFNGVGGGWTLGDALTCTGASLTLTAGTLSFGNFNVSVPTLVTNNSNVRTLTLGSGTLSLTGSGTVFNAATSTNLTLTTTTGTIKLTDTTSSAKTFSGGGKIYGNFWITGAGTGAYTIVGNNTFKDFKIDTPPHTCNFTASSVTTIETFTVNGTAGNLITLQSTSAGTAWRLVKSTSGNISCDYLSLQDSHATSS